MGRRVTHQSGFLTYHLHVNRPSSFKQTKKCSLGKGISVLSYQELNIENQEIIYLVEN